MDVSRTSNKLPLVVIVGPTASGKTALALALAEGSGGEIICADSRTVYRGMDIGTAKPTPAEQARVPHWGLDLVNPDERFTAADFKDYAQQKIEEIRGRHHIPFLVGGTGLYIDAVVFDYQFGNNKDVALRRELSSYSLAALQTYCSINNIPVPQNFKNKRYVIRAIEQKSINTKRKSTPDDSTLIVGIATDREMLRTRIVERNEQLFNDDVVEEATILGKRYGWEHESMTGNIYPLVHSYLKSELSLAEVKEKNTTQDWRLAKRQMTWLRRNPCVKWLNLTEASNYISQQLANIK